ncbi:MAG: hypothetical protein IIB02_03520 [Thaumarchaeota archaeon]|nr:hypothetical protein [Nitrososphaerota archaeon]
MNKQWMGRRWLEFTKGYSAYLIFIIGFSNFIFILYGLAPSIPDIFPNFLIFALVILVTVIPVGILIGHFHFHKQYPIESDIAIKKNPYSFKIFRKSKEEITLKAQSIQMNVLLTLLEKQANQDDLITELKSSITDVDRLLKGENSGDIL